MNNNEQLGKAEFEHVRREQDAWMAERKAEADAKLRIWEREQRNVKCDQPDANPCHTVGYGEPHPPRQSLVERLHAEARMLDQTIDRYRQVAELAMLLERHPEVARIFELYYKVAI